MTYYWHFVFIVWLGIFEHHLFRPMNENRRDRRGASRSNRGERRFHRRLRHVAIASLRRGFRSRWPPRLSAPRRSGGRFGCCRPSASSTRSKPIRRRPPSAARESGAIAGDVRTVTRPRALLALLGASLASFAAMLAVPVSIAGAGARRRALSHALAPRRRARREDGTEVRAGEMNVDSALAIYPQGSVGDAQSRRRSYGCSRDAEGTAQGYVAYSRLCTHAGCPVALYRAAARPTALPVPSVGIRCRRPEVRCSPGRRIMRLPRLPIEVGDDGVLRALGDFPEPVGPAFWERG